MITTQAIPQVKGAGITYCLGEDPGSALELQETTGPTIYWGASEEEINTLLKEPPDGDAVIPIPAPLMRPTAHKAFGLGWSVGMSGRTSSPSIVTARKGGRKFEFFDASRFGRREDIETFTAALELFGKPWRPSRSAVAREALKTIRKATGAPLSRQLPPRWRNIAVASTHAPPMAAFDRGPMGKAYEWDMRGAYHQALRAIRLPMPGTYRPVEEGVTWADLQHVEGGFLTCQVQLLHRGRLAALPWSPQRSLMRMDLKRGEVVLGSWPIAVLRNLEAFGVVRVGQIIDGATCQMGRPHAPLLSLLDLHEKWVQKLVYTRIVGIWQSEGWQTGKITNEGEEWKPPRPHWWSGHPPTYRPDWAAHVMGWVWIRMFKQVEHIERRGGRVFQVLTDAIFTDLDDPGAFYPGFEMKHSGELNIAGTGIYRLGDRYKTMGIKRDLVTGPKWEEGTKEIKIPDWGLSVLQAWPPLFLEDGRPSHRVFAPCRDGGQWTIGGWCKRKRKDGTGEDFDPAKLRTLVYRYGVAEVDIEPVPDTPKTPRQEKQEPIPPESGLPCPSWVALLGRELMIGGSWYTLPEWDEWPEVQKEAGLHDLTLTHKSECHPWRGMGRKEKYGGEVYPVFPAFDENGWIKFIDASLIPWEELEIERLGG